MINTKTQTAVLDIVNFVSEKEITHLYPDNQALTGNMLNLRSQPTVNFGSCSYLGLEFDERLVQGAIDGVTRFGTQFSISRAYLSCPLYKELETNFRQIFGKPCVVTPTTTLGHIAAIPVLVGESDAIILDHQVHSSIQMAVQMLKANGVTIQMIRHNRMDILEDRIKKLRQTHDKIWYMADGIYSMYGDKAPLDDIYSLMDKYPELHLYVDDAHGMSCYGDKGQGYVLSHAPINDRTIVTLSLAKAFGSGGAVFVFPNEKLAREVQCTGLPMITSGPIQPAVLGASIASSKIHLSPDIEDFQTDLHQNIKYANTLLNKFQLPLLNTNDSPIFFIGAGLPKTGRNIVNRMMNEGIYQNIGVFPAVPIKNTGIRFTITKLHTFEQIEHMVEALAHHYPLALEEEKVSMDNICRNFNLPTEDYLIDKSIESVINYSELSVEQYNSVNELNKKQWDALFHFNSQLSVDQLRILEHTYQGNDLDEHNWTFNYVFVKCPKGKIVVAAPIITALQKDDIFHSPEISQSIEFFRKNDPYYLTSRVLMTGSPTTIGKSIYLDNDSAYIDEAVNKFTLQLNKIQIRNGAKSIMLRDFGGNDASHKLKFQNAGFFKLNTFKTNIIENLPATMEEYHERLSKNSKRHIKRKVERFAHKFDYVVTENPTILQVEKWYDLYQQVSKRKREINVFDMPYQLFKELSDSDAWEVHELVSKDNAEETVGVLYIHKDPQNGKLTPNYIGLSDAHIDENVYQQLMYNVVKYAIDNGYTQMDLGATAEFEKSRIGATSRQLYALFQADDHYNQSHIEAVHTGNNKQPVWVK